ncbi:MAG: adenylosuccinate lyase [Methanobacterium formicicum]|jgi:adenylosuccinate lyase|uniref:Adenylosuccinate lyase n=1 Tax=Methanobacterium formicicum TaxID=2162 RepID=A0A090I3H5_METFO|nr:MULTISPECIES: adenylosuccinate lyase [Methanobacterium]AIS30973.1 adenylosuccinate lyase PurB [Methanobacterium formicicum]MDD4810129.1 adenylosuccinate lyase [Methanobacterium formicicum]MDG3546926.1 adenylosuccinate lyase [Methanobacterium formicicum]MDH2660600.1 adenylosuccinate lyase [Methanobacterium formicicum]CEA13798.1 Adenylosuccinate lyase [Methanobacterium formicicum]
MAIHPIEFRYGTPEMKKVWEAENKLQKMLEVEAALAEAEAQMGLVPPEAAQEIRSKASTRYVTNERVAEIEKETNHDIASIVKALAEVCDGEAGEYVHFGATSNDIIDSSQSLLLQESIDIIQDKITRLVKIVLKLADENKKTVCIGRTHGQHALPTTYGMKFALWADELHRQYERLESCKGRLCVGMMTGAVGTTAALGEDGLKVHRKVSEILGLPAVLISNQVVQRDNHAEYVMSLANLASTLDKIALEIRNLQRTEIKELGESFDPEKQVGSSTMPHKMNPITAERICGVSRIIKAYPSPALQNNALWHERDLTNSSSERIMLPEASILTDYILNLTIRLMEKLVFYPENIERNLNFTGGLIMAERFMSELTMKGMGRQSAYALVRKCALEANQKNINLKDVVLQQEGIKDYLSPAEVEEIMDPHTYLGSSVQIVDNVLEKSKEWF